MSIINDALKRAEKKKQLFQNKPSQILNKIDEIKTDAERFVLKRRLVWAGTGIVCLLGIVLAVNSFKSSTDSVPAQEAIPKAELPRDTFFLRKMGVEIPERTPVFNLSGIVYDKQEPLAIINQRILEEGAFINGAELLEIQPNYVRLSLKGEEFKLEIK